MVDRLRRFLADEEAVTATEYAVLLALILLVAIAGIQIHGSWLEAKATDIVGAIG